MDSTTQVFTNVSNDLIDREDHLFEVDVKQELIEKRGTKRRNVDPSSDCSEIRKKPKTVSPVNEVYQNHVVEAGELTISSPNESSANGSSQDKRSRGRPPGSKSRPKERKLEMIRKRTDRGKTAFTYSMLITMALLNYPEEKATRSMIYTYIVHHFPGIDANIKWRTHLPKSLALEKGFQKAGATSRFWFIIPERRDELIQAIEEKVQDYKGREDALMMKNIDQLPLILAGKSPLPKVAQPITIQPVQIKEERRPASLKEFEEVLRIKPVYHKAPQPEKQAPLRSNWVAYSLPPTPSIPIYSNSWLPAHHTFTYGGPQSGYGMPMYGKVKKETYY